MIVGSESLVARRGTQERRLVWMVDDEWNDYSLEKKLLQCHGLRFRALRPFEFERLVACEGETAIAVITRAQCPITASQIADLKRCRIIAVTASGVDSVALDEATHQGILVCNAQDYCAKEVSDHTIALLLALERDLLWYHQRVRDGDWHSTAPARHTVRQIRSLKLGLIGLGAIGSLVAKKAVGIGIGLVMAHDPRVDRSTAKRLGVKLVGFEYLIETSDIVSLHVPLSPRTTNLIGEAEFTRMKRGVILLNTSRGGLVDEAALVEALASGHVRAAGLDVLTEEPPHQNNALLRMDSVLITPHIAYRSAESVKEVRSLVIQAVATVLEGSVPEFLANPEVLTSPFLRATQLRNSSLGRQMDRQTSKSSGPHST